MKRIVRILTFAMAFFALQFLGATSSSAALRDRSWGVDAYMMGAFLDNDSNVDDNFGVGVHVAYFFMKEHALEFSFDNIFSEVSDDSDLYANLFSAKIGYLYTIMPEAKVTPHLFLGAGAQNLSVYRDWCDNNDDDWDDDYWYYYDDCYDNIIDETEPLAYAGFGMRAFFGRSFHMRADFQGTAVWPDEGEENVLIDQLLIVGVGWVFGGGR